MESGKSEQKSVGNFYSVWEAFLLSTAVTVIAI